MTNAERRVIETALADYKRLLALGWKSTYYDGTAKKHWLACRQLVKERGGRSNR